MANRESVILSCVKPDDSELDEEHADEILISTAEIDRWDLLSVLTHHTVRINANRNRLMQHSSYFRGLLSGNFSEASCGDIPIYWNVESFLSVVRFMFGCSVEITAHNFIILYEAGLFFGVEALLVKCQMWLTGASSFLVGHPPELDLDTLISIWKYGIEHADECVPQLCTSYIARNFMLAIPSASFGDMPYELLVSCVEHPDLTIESEYSLCKAILVWVAAHCKAAQHLSSLYCGDTDILKQIRTSILPLWFASGKKRCEFFSQYAEEGTQSILNLTRQRSRLLDALGDTDLSRLKIRLTQYTEKVDLANCPQMKTELLLLSIIPSSSFSDPILRKCINQCLDHLYVNKSRISWELLGKTLTFEAVQEIDVSNCPMLHLEGAIEYFRKSFPSLRLLKAAYFLNFKTAHLHQLVGKCPQLSEVDLTVDISPVISTEVSVLSASHALQPVGPITAAVGFGDFSLPILSKSKVSNVTKLTLEGRTDITDSDLRSVSELCPSLSYLNLKGCHSVTDAALSLIIANCKKLDSLLACYTSFGQSSVQALCSCPYDIDKNLALERGRSFCSLANKLRILHIGSCKGVDEASLCELMSQTDKLADLCLRDTQLGDVALYSSPASTLQILDVSNTKVSGPALAHIVSRNPGLKSLTARDCKHLLRDESVSGEQNCTSSSNSLELYSELGKSTKLEELALGWGFSWSSKVTLGPALRKLKSLVVGLGGVLGQDGMEMLPRICPLLEILILYFQAISDSLIMEIAKTLTQLRVLALCYCFGEISSLSFKFSMPNLRKLKLERVAAWMTNDDLVTLTQNCANLIELSLLGCRLLNSEAQGIISRGWPGLVSIYLEDCGQVTVDGVSSILDCVALEDVLLRHNGSGIRKNFIIHAASTMPMLRRISLDTCDARDGGFIIPDALPEHYQNIEVQASKMFSRPAQCTGSQGPCTQRVSDLGMG